MSKMDCVSSWGKISENGQIWTWLPCSLSGLFFDFVLSVSQLSWAKQFKILQNDVIYQPK